MLRTVQVLLTLLTVAILNVFLINSAWDIHRFFLPSWMHTRSALIRDESQAQSLSASLRPVAASDFDVGSASSPITEPDNASASDIVIWPPRTLPKSHQLSTMARSDETLRKNYGQNGFLCSDEFGIGMLSAWRSASVSMCSPRSDRELSTVTCFVRHKYDVPRYACALENVLIRDVAPYLTFNANDKEVAEFSEGFITAQCMDDMKQKWMNNQMLEEPVGSDYVRTLRAQNTILECEQWIDHTVLWIHRWDLTNAYHATEEILTIFEVLLLFGVDSTNVELAFQDNRPPLDTMLLLPLFQRLFRNVRVVRDNPFPDRTCFKHALFGVHAGMSHLSQNFGTSRPSACTAFSPILRTAVDWMRVGLQIQTRDELPLAKTFRQVVFVRRKKPFKRVIPNEAIVLADIRRALPDSWALVPIAWEDLKGGFIEQMKIATKTSILVGVHGAGLIHTLFLPQRPALIELFYGDRGTVNRHYSNIAQWLGDTHYQALNIGMGREENVSSSVIINAVIDAIDRISDDRALR